MILRVVSTVSLLALPCLAEPGAVAIVAQLTGAATVLQGSGTPRPVHIFEWLPAEALVETAEASKMVIALATGKRFEIAPRTRARITSESVSSGSGGIRELPAVPAIPRLAGTALVGTRVQIAATRLRGGEIRWMYPCHGARALPESAVLRFDPVDGATDYRVEVMDASGEVVYQTSTQETAVRLPPGILQPDTGYMWRARSTGLMANRRGEAELITISKQQTEERTRLRAAVSKSADESGALLLAGADLRLGLVLEARQLLEQAARQHPSLAGLACAKDEVERRWDELTRP